MPTTTAAEPASTRQRAPPPPVPSSMTKPTSGLEPTEEPTPEAAVVQKQQPEGDAEGGRVATGQPPNKRKHRGLMRAIGGIFKRKCSDTDTASRPNDSESSQRRTARWSHSHRQSLPEVPFQVVAEVAPEEVPVEENEAGMTSPQKEKTPAKKGKNEKPKKAKKAKFFPSQTEQSPTDPPEMLTTTSIDEVSAEFQRVSFLFFGGSDVDSTFQPELRPSDLDDLHENDIRPSLNTKMPLFIFPPLPKKLRRSSVLPDPKEYEL